MILKSFHFETAALFLRIEMRFILQISSFSARRKSWAIRVLKDRKGVEK